MSKKKYLGIGITSLLVIVIVMAIAISAGLADTGMKEINLGGVNFLPLRQYGESLGAQVDWNDALKSAKMLLGTQKLEILIPADKVLVNGVEEKSLVKLIDGRIYLPAEFLAKIFGEQKITANQTIPYTKLIAKNAMGYDVAAGSNACLPCHAKVGDWVNTPHTQKALKGKEYVDAGAKAIWDWDPAVDGGSRKDVVAGMSFREGYIHPKNKDANGNPIDPSITGVRATISENPIVFSDDTYGPEDVAFAIGSNHKQAYAVWVPGYGYKMLNIRYNNIDSDSPSMGDRFDERVWEGSCIGCHVTGYDPTDLPADYAGAVGSATPPFNLDPYLGDLRIGCEACHGPSGAGTHLTGGQTINPANLTQDQQIDICGRCHGNWNPTVPGTTARKDVPEFKPGDSLVYLLSPAYNNGVDRLRRPNWGATGSTKPFLGNGASSDDHQEWYDFKISAHYLKTDFVTCTTCHDPHKNNPGAGYGMRILKNTDTAALCATCHPGTSFVTKKGQSGAINPHTAKPYGEGVPKELWREDGKWPWEK